MCVCVCVPACVKDLIRALRADDSRCEIRRDLGRARVLQKVSMLSPTLSFTHTPHIHTQDLLSILLNCPDDNTLRNDVIR